MKIMVIGSGPIVIGQAAEFDYAGTQACKSLKEEGHEVVLINSNPATIMTDPGVADALYIEPLNVHFCERVIARERPDALLPTLGGQTGLNLAIQLSDLGILEKYDVKLLGTPLSAIRKAEDREQFRSLMREIKEPVPESWIIETPDQLETLLETAPYPCIIRPAYTLGGTGGGIANTREELWEIGNKGLKLSMRSQVMVERSLLGWKEVEYEVMRDSAGNCITVCNMENFDPMGVHTGDSIVVAPSQTLSDIEYHMMRTASLKIINALGIEGGCNVQMALNPDSFDYYIIEVNPRVSRSSALASKATGYPIARVAAKIAVGLTLDQIDNQVTKTTKACFEPALDYCVVKIPRWPFDKFASGDRTLFTQMKATGEVMAIDRTFESALMKAIRGLEVKQKDLRHEGFGAMPDAELRQAIKQPTDERLWAIAEGLHRGWSVDDVHKLCRVDRWFLRKIESLISTLNSVKPYGIREIWNEPFPLLRVSVPRSEVFSVTMDSQAILKALHEETPGFRWGCLVREGLMRRIRLADLAEASGMDVYSLALHQDALRGPVYPHEDSFDARLRDALTEALRHGFTVDQLRHALGYDNRSASLAIQCWNEAEEGLAAISDFFADVYEPKDVFQNNPHEGGTHQELAKFALLASKLTPRLEQILASLQPRADGGVTVHLVIAILHRERILGKVDSSMMSFKMVDTCAGEFESKTPYYYATHEAFSDASP